MAAQKPTNTWIQFGGVLLTLGLIALAYNVIQTFRAYSESDAAGFDFGLFMQVFGYSSNWFGSLIVWAPAVLIPLGLIVWLFGRTKPRDRYRDGTPVAGVEQGSGNEYHPGTEFPEGTGVHPGNPNAFGTSESHTDRQTDEPR